MPFRSISTWIGTETPTETIMTLVREKMDALGLEREISNEGNAAVPGGSGILFFTSTPGLTFSRILSATVNGKALQKTNWAGLLLAVIRLVKARGLSPERLARELQVPARVGRHTDEGYKFYPDLGLSIQGQSAADAWKEISRLAGKFRIPVAARIQWRQNEKAQYPGREGMLTAGRQA